MSFYPVPEPDASFTLFSKLLHLAASRHAYLAIRLVAEDFSEAIHPSGGGAGGMRPGAHPSRKRTLSYADAHEAKYEQFVLQKAIAIASPVATGLRNGA